MKSNCRIIRRTASIALSLLILSCGSVDYRKEKPRIKKFHIVKVTGYVYNPVDKPGYTPPIPAALSAMIKDRIPPNSSVIRGRLVQEGPGMAKPFESTVQGDCTGCKERLTAQLPDISAQLAQDIERAVRAEDPAFFSSQSETMQLNGYADFAASVATIEKTNAMPLETGRRAGMETAMKKLAGSNPDTALLFIAFGMTVGVEPTGEVLTERGSSMGYDYYLEVQLPGDTIQVQPLPYQDLRLSGIVDENLLYPRTTCAIPNAFASIPKSSDYGIVRVQQLARGSMQVFQWPSAGRDLRFSVKAPVFGAMPSPDQMRASMQSVSQTYSKKYARQLLAFLKEG